jgi:peroxiredoxin Q/BCP
VRELREFRVHHAELVGAGVAVAGVTADPVEDSRRWAKRLDLPYPLLSDPTREAGRAFRVQREFGIGGWKVELFRRTTFLADAHGVVRAVWGDVKMRGHAVEVLRHARALAAQD